jgi:hypothetical protein
VFAHERERRRDPVVAFERSGDTVQGGASLCVAGDQGFAVHDAADEVYERAGRVESSWAAEADGMHHLSARRGRSCVPASRYFGFLKPFSNRPQFRTHTVVCGMQ